MKKMALLLSIFASSVAFAQDSIVVEFDMVKFQNDLPITDDFMGSRLLVDSEISLPEGKKLKDNVIIQDKLNPFTKNIYYMQNVRTIPFKTNDNYDCNLHLIYQLPDYNSGGQISVGVQVLADLTSYNVSKIEQERISEKCIYHFKAAMHFPAPLTLAMALEDDLSQYVEESEKETATQSSQDVNQSAVIVQ